MGVLRYQPGTSSNLKWSTLASALSNVGGGAYTSCVVFKINALTTYQGFLYGLSGTGAGTTSVGFGKSSGDVLFSDTSGGSSFQAVTSGVVYMAVVRKGAGNVVPTAELFNKGSGTWGPPSSGSSALPDLAALTMIQTGSWQNSDYFDGWQGVAALWEGQMSQAQAQALSTGWQTSTLWNSAFGQPVFLAEQNVSGASVVDLAGNASGLAVTGTSLDAGETLTSWNFDGTGSSSSSSGESGTIAAPGGMFDAELNSKMWY